MVFLNSLKFTELHLWLIEAAKKLGIDLILKTNDSILMELGSRETILKNNTKPDFVLFWDKDIRLARYLEAKKILLFNSSKGIEISDDKSYTHLYLQNAGIKMPKTIIAPMTFSNIGYTKSRLY